jgi:hypothetical protein
MKLTKTQLKQIIKKELQSLKEVAGVGGTYGPSGWPSSETKPSTSSLHTQAGEWDRGDDLWEKFANAIAISLEKGLTADDVQQTFNQAFEQVTTSGRVMGKP